MKFWAKIWTFLKSDFMRHFVCQFRDMGWKWILIDIDLLVSIFEKMSPDSDSGRKTDAEWYATCLNSTLSRKSKNTAHIAKWCASANFSKFPRNATQNCFKIKGYFCIIGNKSVSFWCFYPGHMGTSSPAWGLFNDNKLVGVCELL